ncbi:uncharacterized protein HMPREF1541_05868 [Cyphellophora europaea CBS 101466]|uniref:Homeobox domain-containing protein n=1 Tax=Cyphellophora europaea (strain CBS 101466) TaxID=1220924 RepID=W2RT51_CYPE1|nr:uncharacterized protein HMPREF1541_05868 [Cyphellophora europaea CBS 101466]ETN39642.1 hypothetical protein HMPREF1541_05868 [Cyphellophora europaea CBS 101466]
MSTSYQRQSFYNQPFGQSKQVSTLPPMREIPFDYHYVSGPAQHTMYNSNPQPASAIDPGHNSVPRRSNFYGQTFPGADRGFHGMDGGYKTSYSPSQRSPSEYYGTHYSGGYGSLPPGVPYSPMDNGGGNKRRRGNLPRQTTDLLKSWLLQHIDHPYPTEEEKQYLMSQTGLNLNQISNWFINARRRHWPTMKKELAAKKDEENGHGHDSESSR